MCGSCCCQQVCCQSNVGNNLCDYRIVYIIPKDSLLANEISKGLVPCTCQQNNDVAPAPVKQEATENITSTVETTEITESITQVEQKEEPEPDIKRIEVKVKGKSEAVVVEFDSNIGADDTKDPQVFLFKEEVWPDRDVTLGKQLPVTRKEDKSASSSVIQFTTKDPKSAADIKPPSKPPSGLNVSSQPDVKSATGSSAAISQLYVSSQPNILKPQKFTSGCIHNKDSCCDVCCQDNKGAVRHKKKKRKKVKQDGFFSWCCSCCRSDKPKKHKEKGKYRKERKHHNLDYDKDGGYEEIRHDRNKYDRSLREKGNNEVINYDRSRYGGNSSERVNVNERNKNEAGRCVCIHAHRNACGCTGSYKQFTNSILVDSSSKTTSVTSYQTSDSERSSMPFPRDEYRRK